MHPVTGEECLHLIYPSTSPPLLFHFLHCKSCLFVCFMSSLLCAHTQCQRYFCTLSVHRWDYLYSTENIPYASLASHFVSSFSPNLPNVCVFQIWNSSVRTQHMKNFNLKSLQVLLIKLINIFDEMIRGIALHYQYCSVMVQL